MMCKNEAILHSAASTPHFSQLSTEQRWKDEKIHWKIWGEAEGWQIVLETTGLTSWTVVKVLRIRILVVAVVSLDWNLTVSLWVLRLCAPVLYRFNKCRSWALVAVVITTMAAPTWRCSANKPHRTLRRILPLPWILTAPCTTGENTMAATVREAVMSSVELVQEGSQYLLFTLFEMAVRPFSTFPTNLPTTSMPCPKYTMTMTWWAVMPMPDGPKWTRQVEAFLRRLDLSILLLC
jgi:hypothetical protein